MTGCILIVDPVPAMRALLRSKLEVAYFQTAQASGFEDVFHVAEDAQPDAILISSALGARAACQLCRALKATPALSLIPILITTHPGASYLAEAFAAGADDAITHPVSDAHLHTRLRKLVRGKLALDVLRLRDDAARALGYDPANASRTPPMLAGHSVVHLMPASLAEGSNWTRCLGKAGFRTQVFIGAPADDLPDMADAAACIIEHAPDQGVDGLKALARLRARPALRQTPVIMALPGEPAPELACLALEMGASDFMGGPCAEGEIAGRVQAQLRLRRQTERLQQTLREGVRLSLIDPLTRLHNRRYALTELEVMRSRVQRDGVSAAIMMLDLDKFKAVNDAHGHAGGDHVLRIVGERLQETLGERGLAARFGGEEFCIARLGVSPSETQHLAEDIRAVVESKPIYLPNGARIDLTVSIGVSMASPERDATVEQLLDCADRALYASKAAGRNCVRFHRAAA